MKVGLILCLFLMGCGGGPILPPLPTTPSCRHHTCALEQIVAEMCYENIESFRECVRLLEEEEERGQ